MRRRFYLGLVVGCGLIGLAAGCQHTYRPPMTVPYPATPQGVLGHDTVTGGSEIPEEVEARAQHKANRRAGTWSEEAADIEASLGVPK